MTVFKKYFRFLVLLVFLLLSLTALHETKTLVRKEDAGQMEEAARRTEAAFKAIREARLALGHAISPADDPNSTGMVGEAYTEITTTLGSLESKRSAANPNTGAMVYDMLVQCGVKPGDRVAVNFSGSFPALNTAVLCALDTLGARATVISSVGASTYGANLPDFTWQDMEHVLLSQGLIENHSAYFSMGGAGDVGKEMPEDTKKAIISRLTGYGLQFLSYEDLNENLSARLDIYTKEGTPACFINAGGNLLSFAGGEEMISAKNGILLPGRESLAGRGSAENSGSSGGLSGVSQALLSLTGQETAAGLVPSFLGDGVPVIHLLNMKSLLPAWDLPFDPAPMPEPGQGGVYSRYQYNKTLAVFCLAASLGLLIWAAAGLPRRRIPL